MKKTHRGKKPNPAIVKTSEEEGDETKGKGQNRIEEQEDSEPEEETPDSIVAEALSGVNDTVE